MEQATSWLTGCVSELQVSLEAAEAAVKTFNVNSALVSQAALEGLNRQVKDVRERVGVSANTSDYALAKLSVLQTAYETGDRSQMVEIANVSSLRRTFDLVENGSMNANVFDSQFQREITSVRNDVARLSVQEKTLQTSMVELEKQIEQQSQDLVKLQQLQREAEASRLIYEYFLGRLKETSVQAKDSKSG